MRAKWCECKREYETVYVRKEFELTEVPKNAVIRICGLGFYELYINGRRVNEGYFMPVWSDYGKRDFIDLLYPTQDTFTHRIYYNKFDVSAFLQPGGNCIAVVLGNGWYRQKMRNIEGKLHYGETLKLYFDLEIDGSDGIRIVSDKTLEQSPGHIIQSNLYYGEIHDYRDFSEDWKYYGFVSDWENVKEIPRPKAAFNLQKCPVDVCHRRIVPKLIACNSGKKIYDAGENISGFAVVRGVGNIRVTYAEDLKDGKMDYLSQGGDSQIGTDEYRNVERGRICKPSFVWHAFRYVEVENGECDGIEVIYSDVKLTADFRSDDETLNWLFEAFVRTQTNNMHCGVPSDCPHRERLGYTGDGQLVCETAMLLFDCRDFYRKWIADIADCQDTNSGHIQHTAPFYGGGGGPGGWGVAIVAVPYKFLRQYGDREFVKKFIPNMKKWVLCMEKFSRDGLIVREYDGGWCLGDWCAPGGTVIPEPFVNTYYFVKGMEYLEYICRACGIECDYSEKIKASKAALVREYCRDGIFCDGVQGANAFALDLGLGDRELLKDCILRKYEASPCFDTGIFGTDVLANVLSVEGKQILADMLVTREYPSFGYWKEKGATTLYENWDCTESHDHPMFGACVRHLFTTFLGIKRQGDGFGKFTVEPFLPEGVNMMEGSLMTGKGTLSVKIQRDPVDRSVVVTLDSPVETKLIFGGLTKRVGKGKNIFNFPVG
ncbi:MAG: family 78 glycoside hydrolase catalytic domain [Christensenellales bacterium]